MVGRRGGARDIEVYHYPPPEGAFEGAPERDMLVLHLLVDTRDAMCANIVNGMCEGWPASRKPSPVAGYSFASSPI